MINPIFQRNLVSCACAMGIISPGSHFNFDFIEMASSVTALHNKVAIKLSPTHKHRMINAQSLQMLLPCCEVSADNPQQGWFNAGRPSPKAWRRPGPLMCKSHRGAEIVIIVIIQDFNKYANVTLLTGFIILKDHLDILRF
jgi:hypothetical protein